jgi:hypothetical protein
MLATADFSVRPACYSTTSFAHVSSEAADVEMWQRLLRGEARVSIEE